MPNAKPARRRGIGLVLLALAAGIAVVVLMQEALAVQVGAVLAGVWLSTVSAIAGLLGGLFGG